MNLEPIKIEKNDVELKIDNLTIAEIISVYLNKEGIDFAAWRREHPFKPITLKIKSTDKTVKKAVSDSISSIKKDLDLLNKKK